MTRFREGDRVRVATAVHAGMSMAASGTIEIVSRETAYAIRFDGMDEVHKWYVDSELVPEGDGTPHAPASTSSD